MKLHTLRRTGGLAAAALVLTAGLAACGDDGDSNDSDSTAGDTMSESESTPAEESSSAAAADTEIFGAGCSALPTDGAGSVDVMSTEPVADAAGGNPLLATLVTAVQKAGLVDALNTAEGITVFAPTNDAFAKIPEADLNALLADEEKLSAVLTHHVVPQQLAPEELAGEFETLNGDMITVEGSGEEFSVDDEGAAVVCGNIPTANATVYVVDTVLMPN